MAAQPQEIATGVYWLQTFWANVYLVRSGTSWALIDTGMPKCGRLIQDSAVSLFGAVRPASILLTHFHEDHAGSALVLSREWSVPIYVHRDELPFVTGTPAPLIEPPKKPDPPVGGFMLPLGVLIMLSQDPRLIRFFSRVTERFASKFNLGDAARGYVPGDGVPGLPDWECIPTPGHTPGHVAFFRAIDRVIILGDALLTVDLNSFWGFLLWSLQLNKQQVSGPPWYSTWNWQAAKESATALARLEPRLLASGHGVPISGDETGRELRTFAYHFFNPGSQAPSGKE